MTSQPDDMELYRHLANRSGTVHLRQRLGIEHESEQRVFHKGWSLFHIENVHGLNPLLHVALRLLGLDRRGRRNALNIRIRHNTISIPTLPRTFDGFRILHLSDLHLDMNSQFPPALAAKLKQADYDLCVLTGDYRYQTWGPIEPALSAMQQIRPEIRTPVYAILGNHDSIRMAPAIEALDIRLLMNESVALERDGEVIHLAGIDDAHYFRADNLHLACQDIPQEAVSILLSHTPEIYRQAAHAGFDVMFCGHTHGGQIRLPGGFALTYNARCPRSVCAGSWSHHRMQGYTSVGAGSSIIDMRFNCPPEITLHQLRCAQEQ